MVQAEVQLPFVTQNNLLVFDVGCIFKYILVWTHGNAIFRKYPQNICVYPCGIGEEDGVFFGNISVSDCYRSAGNVIGADVVQPCNAVECVDKDCLCSCCFQLAAQLFNLLLCRFSGVFYRQVVHCGRALSRTVFPQVVGVVYLIVNLNIFLFKSLLHLFDISHREELTIDSDHCIFRQLFCKIFMNLGSFRLVHFKEDALAAGELFFGLNIISAVSPQTGDRLGDNKAAGRTGETGKPCAGLPVFRVIFTHVRVCTWNDDSVDMIFRHPFPNLCNLFVYGHFPFPPFLCVKETLLKFTKSVQRTAFRMAVFPTQV